MTDTDAPVVAVDGPSGSGKGTIGRLLAHKLGWHYLDSGALYRLVALAALQRGVDFNDSEALAEIAATLNVRFTSAAAGERVLLDGVDVLLDLNNGDFFELDEVGSRLWEGFDGTHTVDEQATALAETHDVAVARACSDTIAFASELHGKGLVEIA